MGGFSRLGQHGLCTADRRCGSRAAVAQAAKSKRATPIEEHSRLWETSRGERRAKARAVDEVTAGVDATRIVRSRQVASAAFPLVTSR